MTIGLENPGRRGLMLGAAAAAVTAGTGALAKAPMLKSQAPYFYRFMLGDAEATIVSDGTLPLGDPHTNFLGLSAAEMDEQLTRRTSCRCRTRCWNRTSWSSTPAAGWCCSTPAWAR